MSGGMYCLEIIIKDLPPTTNSHGRVHWAMKAKLAREWRRLVVLMVGSKRPLVPLKKAKLELTRASSGRCDADGLVSSFKHVIDGLVDAGVLEDDKFSNIGMPTYLLEKSSPKNGYIRIVVREDI